MRLTESNPLKDFVPLKYTSKKPIFLDYDKGDTKVIEELLNKLGQLEDIEDELGIDLITLFNEINGTKAYEIISGIADAIKRKRKGE